MLHDRGQLEFWTGFSEYLDSTDTSFNARKARAQNWYQLSIGTALASLSLTMLVSKSGRLGVELYIPGRSGADLIFEAPMEDKDVIEVELGQLDWQDLPERKACRIAEYLPTNLEDHDQWESFYEWMKDRAEGFKATFAERVKNVHLPEQKDVTVQTARAEIESSALAPTVTTTDGASAS